MKQITNREVKTDPVVDAELLIKQELIELDVRVRETTHKHFVTQFQVFVH